MCNSRKELFLSLVLFSILLSPANSPKYFCANHWNTVGGLREGHSEGLPQAIRRHIHL